MGRETLRVEPGTRVVVAIAAAGGGIAELRMNEVRQEWYKLRDALEGGDFSGANSLVKKDAGLVHERNRLGETVLHFLGVENNQAAVRWLAERGAELNPVNEFGTPLLFEVAMLGYRDLFVWLVEHGADLRRKDADGMSLSEHLIEFGKFEMATFIRDRFTDAAQDNDGGRT